MKETKFKQTEIGEVPENWEVITLGSLGDVKMCKRVMKYQTFEDGDVPFFKIGTFGGTPDAYISRRLFEDFRRNYSYPRKGDILLSAAGTIGRTVVFDGEDAYFQDSNIVWIDNDEKKVLNKYLYFCYKAMKWQTENGGIVVRLYNENLKATKFAIPPMVEEQERIAEALSDVDGLLRELDAEIAKKRAIKQGAMQELLTGKRRLEGFGGEWEEKKLSNLFDFYKGYGLSKDAIKANGKNKCILYGEIFTTYDTEVKNCASMTDHQEGLPSKIGDVLMPGSTTTSGIDLVKAICVNEDNILLGGDIIVLRPKVYYINSYFMASLISNIQRNKIAEMTQGITIIHLHSKDIVDIIYTIPVDKAEQTAIAKILSDMDADIEALEAKRAKYAAVKQGMMQELLTGKIRLT